jgi:GxxExxY protein
MNRARFQELAYEIFHASLEVHKTLGPGLLESVYEYALLKEFDLRNIPVEYQVKLPLIYKGHTTNKDFYLDIVIEGEIIIEIKAVEGLLPVHQAQLLSYLKLADKRLGFLINFNVVLLKDGFRRMVNNF